MYFKIIILLLLFIQLHGSFDDFISNQNIKDLIAKYKQREIKTIRDLHNRICQIQQISFRTLNRYLDRLKVNKCVNEKYIFRLLKLQQLLQMLFLHFLWKNVIRKKIINNYLLSEMKIPGGNFIRPMSMSILVSDI